MRTKVNTDIECCHVEWKNGQPYASAFEDVYFSSDNGLLETNHVFLQGNDLPNRWQNLTAKTFTIAETGFGTGLNFICAAKLWLATAPDNANLHYISVEKHPLNLADISTALQLWPELRELSALMLASYEKLLNNAEPVDFIDGRIRLSLLIGDATECFNRLSPSNVDICNASNNSVNISINNPVYIDAWFLDGFSPAKNPDMWQSALFAQMTRLANAETTLATFTSAGAVRRGLLAAGFTVTKRAGFGKKREMLTGRFTGAKHAT